MENNFTYNYFITESEKTEKKGYRSSIFWFFGLSGSGKSTLCNWVEKSLFKKGIDTIVLDGDSLRRGINKDLGFSKEDRIENIRRVSEIAKLLKSNGIVVLCSFITPLERTREMVNTLVERENIFWIYLNTPLDVCKKRDPKGLYKRAESGELKNFTGISDPFEEPKDLDFIVNYKKDLNLIGDDIVREILKKLSYG